MRSFITLPPRPEHSRFSTHEGYMEGQLLIATPQVQSAPFDQSVIYIFSHNAHGAMGLIINKPFTHMHMAEVYSQLHLDANNTVTKPHTVHFGGPLEEKRGFLLHSNDIHAPDTIKHTCGISITASLGLLERIAQGAEVAHCMFCIGYAGWDPSQLEQEMEANSWISVEATPELVFATDDDEKWLLSAASLGVDMQRLSYNAGHA